VSQVPDKNPKAKLYHVTRAENAELIKQQGFRVGFGITEGGEAVEKARRILAGEAEEYEDVFAGEEPAEARARRVFNDLLDRARATVNPELPSHASSIFFWSSPQEAAYRRLLVQDKTREKMETLIVDASKIPCRCYEADIGLTDALFNEVEMELEVAEVCADHVAPPEDFDWKACRTFDKLAEKYYRKMKPFSGKPKLGKEVLCPCDIPKEAIEGQM